MVYIQPGNGNEKCKGIKIVPADDVYVKCLGAFIQLGEDKPAQFCIRFDLQCHRLIQKKLVNHRRRRQLAAVDINIGDFERREVLGVETHGEKCNRCIRAVFDLEPDRLDSAFVEWNAKNLLAFLRTGYAGGHTDAIP